MLKKIIVLVIGVILMCLVIYFVLINSGKNKVRVVNDDKEKVSETMPKIEIKIASQSYIATLENNEAALAFIELLPMTITMKEFNSNEKYYDLLNDLPVSEDYYSQIESGDLMLYGSKTVVLFYKTFTTNYNYTRIGKIINPEGLQDVLGDGDKEISFGLIN